jgi:hypothetical protein
MIRICSLCKQKYGSYRDHIKVCSANAPLPGFIHKDCGGTVVPYDGKIMLCLKCRDKVKNRR